MRNLSVVAALAIVLLGINDPAQAGWSEKECRYRAKTWPRDQWSVAEVKATIRCAAPRFGISTSMALEVAGHESGFQAVTGYDAYCGVYQHARSSFSGRLAGAEQTWPRYRWFGDRCENARSNIFAAFYLVKISGGWDAHWCRWTTYC